MSEKKKERKRSCMAPNCTFKESSGLCTFPSNPDLLKKWCEILRLPLFEPKSHQMVCRNHFCDDDFYEGPVKKKLKPNRFPSRFLPNAAPEKVLIVKTVSFFHFDDFFLFQEIIFKNRESLFTFKLHNTELLSF